MIFRPCSLEDVYFPSYKSAILPGVVQAVEPVTEGETLLQKGQKAIAQTSKESVSEVCVDKPLSESHSNRRATSFEDQYFEAAQNERNSVCLLLKKKVYFVLGFLVTLLAVIGIYAAMAVILSGKLSDNRT